MARRNETQADGVYAVPLVRGGVVSLASEDMPQVGIAGRAPDLDAGAPGDGMILQVDDPVPREGFEEAGPAAVGGKLRLAAEQLGPTGPAFVYTIGGGVCVFTREGGLSSGFPQHVVFEFVQPLSPFLVGQVEREVVCHVPSSWGSMSSSRMAAKA